MTRAANLTFLRNLSYNNSQIRPPYWLDGTLQLCMLRKFSPLSLVINFSLDEISRKYTLTSQVRLPGSHSSSTTRKLLHPLKPPFLTSLNILAKVLRKCFGNVRYDILSDQPTPFHPECHLAARARDHASTDSRQNRHTRCRNAFVAF